MIDPVSTYRVQFNKDFTFKKLKSVLPYLRQLGIKTIYASPIYKAVPGSNHGYDVTDPNQINPEIGTLEELREISAILQSYNMYWLQDIVPNHMGFHHDNAWLMDVLKNGEQSPYRKHFDLITADMEKDPIMVPFLENDLEKVIGVNELQLQENKGSYYLKYLDGLWPINDKFAAPKDTDIKEIASNQYYRLCSYRETDSEINYRRFFTVNSLICLNMQFKHVFEAYHQLTKQLLAEGIFQGLRIDHIDGLADPQGYLRRLRELCGDEVYIVVEKILEPGEGLMKSWPVQGSTGYDYLGLANQLFTHKGAKKDFEHAYGLFAGKQADVEDQILEKKSAFLESHMQGELENLYRLTLNLLPNSSAAKRPLVLKDMLAAVLVELPVYRLHTNGPCLAGDQSGILNRIFEKLERTSKFEPILTEFKALLLDMKVMDGIDIPYFNRLMQFTGPLMAKGVEDTLMYTYHRFIGTNEVGDSPVHFGMHVRQFHQEITDRARRWPLAMNASATHDTKRAEDGRSRLAALTRFADDWTANIALWRSMNHGLKTGQMPDENDEYFIYQTLVATCPEQGPGEANYPERLTAYLEKAFREAKRCSNWDEPNTAYEEATRNFAAKLLDTQGSFWNSFAPFLRKVTNVGKLNSLSALALKHTLPGVPDTYQGTEFFDLSMVDPDNRRAVDYKARQDSLNTLKDSEFCTALGSQAISDEVKLHLIQKLLWLRQKHRELFAKGDYQALAVSGEENSEVIAYTRRYNNQWLLVAIPLLSGDTSAEKEPFKRKSRNKIQLALPTDLSRANIAVTNILNAKTSLSLGTDQLGKISLAKLLDGLPFAVYHIDVPQRKRGAGILMHLTSLPTAYGIGDLGPSAHRFLEFLAQANMKYWQVLPINPITADQSFSPYSSTSAMAGNVLLISPEELAETGLLSREEITIHRLKKEKKVAYQKAEGIKLPWLKKAYLNWTSMPSVISKDGFEAFCIEQRDWLDDYTLFVLLGQLENGKPWYQWPTALKKRQSKALDHLRQKHQSHLTELKWQQFVFFRQWNALRKKAAVLGIELIGDIPFYCAHNSAEVWANPKLFAIGKNGKMLGVAGVPPDYFNADGQLWGMPVYDWAAMSRQKFRWWRKRMAMNLALYDKVRLDHFRAFDEYWEIPEGSKTASTGIWKTGPKKTFFEAMEKALGDLPLIAEDLGAITEDVYRLRDELKIPGMKVLQFAFGDDMPHSVHIPHKYQNPNSVVYTGTHDNNTTRGWFEEDTDQATRSRIERYLGTKVANGTIAQHLIRLALASTADIAIIPLQDLLNKGAGHRMNMPASVVGNWIWRIENELFYPKMAEQMASQLKVYGR